MLQVVFPVSDVDLHLATKLLERLAAWSDHFQQTRFNMLCTWSDRFDVQPLAERMSNALTINFLVTPDVPEGLGWPDAANHMFYEAADWMRGSPFYFMEADCFPLRPDFLARLTHEYEEAGKPYMGAIEPSRWTIHGQYTERGKHMVGTGIYPANFLGICREIEFVPKNVPWDVYIEEHVIPECHETKLIHHALRTAKYSRVNGVLNCVDHVERPGKHSYARPVPKEAVVIHGCKDLSLYDIDF